MPIADSTRQTKSNEWYTPSYVIEAARRVMGHIDLDPASCSVANETVQATKYYAVEDDGLRQQWQGKVWLNPPYSQEHLPRGMHGTNVSIAAQWIRRLIHEYQQGHVDEAILLVKADPKQRWFVPLWEFFICFTTDRILFNRPGLPPEKHQFGSCFVYMGSNTGQFIKVFQQFGTIAKKVTVSGSLCTSGVSKSPS